jgi:hypothetical protein
VNKAPHHHATASPRSGIVPIARTRERGKESGFPVSSAVGENCRATESFRVRAVFSQAHLRNASTKPDLVMPLRSLSLFSPALMAVCLCPVALEIRCCTQGRMRCANMRGFGSWSSRWPS